MVCGGIVEVVPSTEGDRYFLPKHRHQFLMTSSARFHEMLPLIGSVHEDIVACFAEKGPNGKYGWF